MITLKQVPKRVWIGCGAAAILFGGVAVAGAGSMGGHTVDEAAAASGGRVLRIVTAPPPPPPTLPPAPAEAERLSVLADVPVGVVDLDPTLQASADYAALDASMHRYEAQLSTDLAHLQATPAAFAGERWAATPHRERAGSDADPQDAAADDGDVAASGDTGRPSGEA